MRYTRWQMLCTVMFAVLLLGIPPRTTQAQELSYTGATTIAEACLPELIKAFTAQTGLPFTKIETPGAAEGFVALMAGKASIAGMVRALTVAEKRQKPYTLPLGFDVMAIYVHANSPVKALSHTQLKEIFTGKITNWQEVGGPSAPITVIVSDPNKRTLSVEFRRMALNSEAYGPEVKSAPSLKETLAYVAQHEHAITFGSPAMNPAGVQVVAVDHVIPSLETVRNSTYRFHRPMSLLTKEVPYGNVQKFFDFVRSPAGRAIVAKYFLPITDF